MDPTIRLEPTSAAEVRESKAMDKKTPTFTPSRLSLGIMLALAATLPANAQQDAEGAAPTPEKGGWLADPESAFYYWPPAPPADEWDACSLCPDVSGWTGDATAGLGYVSDESAYFGRYTGLDDDGLYFLGSARGRYLGADGKYLHLKAEDVGLDTRSLGVRGGERGRYRAYLNYDRIPGFVAENPRTVFRGVGSTDLTLPADWETATSTGGMGRLDDSLTDVRLGTNRDTLSVGADFFRKRTWEYGIEYRRVEQDGFKTQGASFLTTSSILPMPVDRVTDQIEARIAYLQEDWHAILSYHGSFFSNKADAVTWENPFTPFAAGADRGRISQEPDNLSHQVMLAGNWRPTARLDTSARVAVGRMQQDDTFLAPTINPTLATSALPRNDLDGSVDTLTSNLRAVYSAGSRLTLIGEGFYDDRDNRTPRDEFEQVGTDTFIGGTRTNRPYSFERLGGRLTADFRASSNVRLSAGGRAEQVKRTYQEVDKTETTAGWGEIRATPTDRLDMNLRLTREERTLDDPYTALPDVIPEENPLLRKFHLASRDRDQIAARLSYMVSDRVNLGVSADYAKDDYDRSQVGLIDARDRAYTMDVSATPRDNLTVSAFYGREQIDSTMASSAGFGVPDWTAGQRDTIDTVGITLEVQDLGKDGFDAGIDYAYSSGKGRITMQTGVPTAAFPDLESRLNTVRLFGRYRLSDKLSVRVDYLYERYRSRDFALDDVAPDTIPSVLTLGEETPNYSAHFIGTSLNYRF
jgi:MtrB/PioB family decaheme-associated outer membrane protein